MIGAGSRLRGQRITLAAIIAVAAFIAFVAISEVKHHHQLVKLSYELSEVTAQLREAEEENRRLRLERSMLLAPDRIERLAGELGMVRPEPSQIHELSGERSAALDRPSRVAAR